MGGEADGIGGWVQVDEGMSSAEGGNGGYVIRWVGRRG